MREVKKPEERKAEILAMSKQLFAQKGYMNTTTQDIISSLNISRGLLYYHLSQKRIYFGTLQISKQSRYQEN